MFLVHFKTRQIAFSKANVLTKWPGVMSRNASDSFAQGGSSTITTEVFPENESDRTQLYKLHCKSEAVCRSFRISSFTSSISIIMT